jgi:hypothetical protein
MATAAFDTCTRPRGLKKRRDWLVANHFTDPEPVYQIGLRAKHLTLIGQTCYSQSLAADARETVEHCLRKELAAKGPMGQRADCDP